VVLAVDDVEAAAESGLNTGALVIAEGEPILGAAVLVVDDILCSSCMAVESPSHRLASGR